MNNEKIGRNDPCPCNSGKKYKRCHLGLSRPIPSVPIATGLQISNEGKSFLNDIFSLIANQKIPIFEYCLEMNIYFFQNISIKQCQNIFDIHEKNDLTIDFLFDCWSSMSDEKYFRRMLQNDINQSGLLQKRKEIVEQIINAHYTGLYAVSIPAAFTVIEGIFREYGQVCFGKNENVQYKIEDKYLKDNMLYSDVDAVRYFTKFLNKLMSGKVEDNYFHRNTVLHGVNFDFATDRNSLTLLLTIFEFSRLIGLEKIWPPKYTCVNGIHYINGYKIEMRDDL